MLCDYWYSFIDWVESWFFIKEVNECEPLDPRTTIRETQLAMNELSKVIYYYKPKLN